MKNNNNPTVLVCLASYNGGLYIADQLNSILNQKNCNVKIVISDDNSTDNTKEVIELFMKQNKNIFLLKNQTFQKGSNTNFYNLIKKAKDFRCDYVAFSDQDDIFIPNKFIKQINTIKDNDKVVGCSSSVKCFGISKMILIQSPNITSYDFIFEGAGQGCTFLVKKYFFDDFSMYIEKKYNLVRHFLFHDWLCYLYCRSSSMQWIFMKEPLVKYRIHNNNSFGNKYSFLGMKNRILKLFSGWYYNQILLANKIASDINPKIPNIFQLRIYKLIYLLIFKSRRKKSDRLFAFISLILCHLFK